MENRQKQIGASIERLTGIPCEKILLERYFYNGDFYGIIKIYIYDGIKYYEIICAEGDVCIHTLNDSPESVSMGGHEYQIDTLDEEWACRCGISSVAYICSKYEKNGIVILLDNGHNIVFYNTGYEDGDNDIFETDADISKLKEKYGIIICSKSAFEMSKNQ